MSRTRRDAHKAKGQERKLRPGTFTPILNDVLTDPGISPAAFKLLMYLATKPVTWIVQTADIVKGTGLTRYTIVEKARPELTRLGFLTMRETRDETGHVIKRELSLVRNMVVYVGNGAGRSLRHELQPDVETVAWVDDVSAGDDSIRDFPESGWPVASPDVPESAVAGDVSPGQDSIREIPESGNCRLLVSTEGAVITEHDGSEPPKASEVPEASRDSSDGLEYLEERRRKREAEAEEPTEPKYPKWSGDMFA